MRFWKIGIVAIALLALGGVAAGIVAAQTGGTETPGASATATEENATATAPESTPSGEDATPQAEKERLLDDFLARLAENLGVSEDDLRQALSATASEMLDQAVADGIITQEEADRIRSRIEEGDLVFPFFGRGHHGPGGHDRKFGFFAYRLLDGDLIAQTATFLGVDRQTVLDGLANEQSLAQIAEANGRSADDLAGYLYDQLESGLDQAVAENKITQDRADNILSNAQERIDEAINRVGPFGGPRDWNDNGTPSDSPTSSSGTANPASL